MEADRPFDPESLQVLVHKYPDGPFLEDGETFSERILRIECFVSGVPGWDPRDAATEHWLTTIAYRGPDMDGVLKRDVEYWSNRIPHQNQPDGSGRMNFQQATHRMSKNQNGLHTVIVDVRGDVSGIVAQVVRRVVVNV